MQLARFKIGVSLERANHRREDMSASAFWSLYSCVVLTNWCRCRHQQAHTNQPRRTLALEQRAQAANTQAVSGLKGFAKISADRAF